MRAAGLFVRRSLASSSLRGTGFSPPVARYFHNQAFESPEGNALVVEKCLSTRIEMLSRGEPVSLACQAWMGEGLPIHRGDIFHTINRLRKFKLHSRALEVMEWVIRERPYRLRELEYAYLLEFTARVHGISSGEKLFSSVPCEYQNELLYNNLVLACLERGIIKLSLEYMKKMRELGHPISHLVFNRLIILHSSPGRRKMIPELLALMKADNVVPHVSTFNILMKIHANDHNIEALLKVYSDMRKQNVEPNEISYCVLATAHIVARLFTAANSFVEAVEKTSTGRNWSTHNILMILYSYLGKVKELERIWARIQERSSVSSKSYMNAIEAFGRMGMVNEAEELWLEMKSIKDLKSSEQFNSILSVYCNHGLMKKAAGILREMEGAGCSPNAITYRHLTLGCLKADLEEEALKTFQKGSSMMTSNKVRNSLPWLETSLAIIEAFGEKGDYINAEKLYEELNKAKYTRYTFVHNSLIQAYVKAKFYNPHLLRRMILASARPDSETYSLIKLVDQFKKV